MSEYIVIGTIIAAFAVAAVLSYFFTPPVKNFAHKVGAIDVPKDARRMHKKPIPRLGGLAIYGGLIGAVVFGGLMAKIRKMKVAAVLDIASLGFLIGQGIGRWGNFINQEAFGSATDLPSAPSSNSWCRLWRQPFRSASAICRLVCSPI